MRSSAELEALLHRLDGRSYKAYADLRGAWALGEATLFVDHVQGDPFAAPSRVRLRMPLDRAGFPAALYANPIRAIALRDAIARAVADAIALRAGGRSERDDRVGKDGRSKTNDRVGKGGRSERDDRSDRGGGSGKSGLIAIDDGRQTVLERSAVVLGNDAASERASAELGERDGGPDDSSNPDYIEARLEIGLPASGRRIRGRAAATLLCDSLPALGDSALRWNALPQRSIRHFVGCVENQEHLRGQLEARGLVAFVANGAQLPRRAGDSDLPMPTNACVAFESPPSLEVELELLHPIDGDLESEIDGGGLATPGEAAAPPTLRGMGIRRGVTLIVGGGYHGKSTLLQALERCVHPHVPGDGREWVVAAPDLVKIRAEDGRPVAGVDLRPFIGELPAAGSSTARSTEWFTTSDASGSTSQAASIIEALEAGATGLLLDEDTCATNFMIRDARMQALVADADEPITPFLDRVRTLADERDVSTVLVMGGSGDYFDVADTVIAMQGYRPVDVTTRAHEIARHTGTGRHAAAPALPPDSWAPPRRPAASSLDARRGKRDVAVKAYGRDRVAWGEREIDLRGLAQLADSSQTRAVAGALLSAREMLIEDGALLRAREMLIDDGAPEGAARCIRELLDAIESLLKADGIDALALDARDCHGAHPGALARPRRHEIAAALNRLRGLKLVRPSMAYSAR